MESTVKPWYINHPEKANVVGDAFSRVSMSNVSHVKEEKMEFALDMPKEDIEKMVLASEIVQKWSEGKPPKKVIVVQGRIVNVVL